MTLNVNCQHCGEMHAVSVRETYIDDAITNVSEIARPRSVAWRLSAAADKRAEIRGELQSKVIAEIIVAATRLLLRLPRSKAAQP